MATRIQNCLIYLNPTYLSIQDQSLLKTQRIQPLMVVGFTGAFDMLYRSATTSRISRADGYVATRLMCRLICNLPEYNIRIFNPLASYF